MATVQTVMTGEVWNSDGRTDRRTLPSALSPCFGTSQSIITFWIPRKDIIGHSSQFISNLCMIILFMCFMYMCVNVFSRCCEFLTFDLKHEPNGTRNHGVWLVDFKFDNNKIGLVECYMYFEYVSYLAFHIYIIKEFIISINFTSYNILLLICKLQRRVHLYNQFFLTQLGNLSAFSCYF